MCKMPLQAGCKVVLGEHLVVYNQKKKKEGEGKMEGQNGSALLYTTAENTWY